MDAINDWENQALTHRNRLAPLAIKKTHKDRNIPAYALTYVYNTPPINRIKEDYFKVKSGEIKEVY